MAEEQSHPTGNSDLVDFSTRCVDRDTDFETFSASANRVSLRNANITSMEIVDRATPNTPNGSTYRYISFNVTVPEGRPEIWSVLQHSRVDDLPDLALRVQGMLTSNSKGDQYAINITMVKDRDRRAEAAHFVVFRAEFPKLRVYHVLDLLRLFSIEFSKHQDEAHASWKKDRIIVNPLEVALFPLAVAHVLRDFTSCWGELAIPEPARPEPVVYWKIVDAVNDCFIERWCSPAPETPPACSLARSKRHLHSRPTIGGPFFYFHVPHDSLLREIKPTSVVRKSLSEFCDHIRGPSDPPEAYAKISSLKRYQKNKGFKHQFVIMHAELDVPGCPKRDFWIRIDRSPDHDAPKTILASSSIFPPDDKVQLSSDVTLLLADPKGHTVLQDKEYTPRERATLRELTKVLKIFSTVSTQYVFLTENCYYLASLVEEVLSIETEHGVKIRRSTSSTWASITPTKTRQSIMKLWNASQSADSLVETEITASESTGEGALFSKSLLSEEPEAFERSETASLKTSPSVYGPYSPRFNMPHFFSLDSINGTGRGSVDAQSGSSKISLEGQHTRETSPILSSPGRAKRAFNRTMTMISWGRSRHTR